MWHQTFRNDADAVAHGYRVDGHVILAWSIPRQLQLEIGSEVEFRGHSTVTVASVNDDGTLDLNPCSAFTTRQSIQLVVARPVIKPRLTHSGALGTQF